MRQDKRTVDKDFSDIRLNNSFYRVDPRLRGDKVQVRYDPFSDMEKVWIYLLHDEYLGQGSLYHRDQGAEPERVWHKAKPKNNYLELLKQEHDRQHPKGTRAQSKGIDYRQVISQRAWPFAAFVQKLTKLRGRKGGLGAFNGEEYEMLKKAYNRMAELNESILVEAWEKATQKTIPHLLYQLQIIKDRKENR